MEISRETKVLYFSELKIYNYIVKIDNYEEILGDEIKNFEKLMRLNPLPFKPWQ